MELQVGVKALLKNKNGKYLLVRRNPKKYPGMEASWDMVGGRIHPGSSFFENLKREVKEEVQMQLVHIPTLVAAQDIILTDKHVVRLTFLGEIDGSPVIDEESLESGWFSGEEVKKLDLLDRFLKEIIDTKVIIL